jgi:hypothetical protein
MDIPIGKFAPDRFVALAHTAYDMSQVQFACHKSAEGEEFTCAGFLLAGGAHNLGVRLALHRGAIDLNAVQSPYPLFSSFRAMAIANGVEALHPSLNLCRDDGSTKQCPPGRHNEGESDVPMPNNQAGAATNMTTGETNHLAVR